MTVTGALAGAAHPGLDTDLFAHHLPPSARIPQTKSCQWLFVLSNNAEVLLLIITFTLHYIMAPHTETSTQRGYGEKHELMLYTQQDITSVPSPPLLPFPANILR